MVANPQEADGVCSSAFSRNTLQRKFTPELKQHGGGSESLRTVSHRRQQLLNKTVRNMSDVRANQQTSHQV